MFISCTKKVNIERGRVWRSYFFSVFLGSQVGFLFLLFLYLMARISGGGFCSDFVVMFLLLHRRIMRMHCSACVFVWYYFDTHSQSDRAHRSSFCCWQCSTFLYSWLVFCGACSETVYQKSSQRLDSRPLILTNKFRNRKNY